MFLSLTFWTQYVLYFSVKSILCVCAPEASSLHIALVYAEHWTWLPNQCNFNEHTKFTLSADECEIRILSQLST